MRARYVPGTFPTLGRTGPAVPGGEPEKERTVLVTRLTSEKEARIEPREAAQAADYDPVYLSWAANRLEDPNSTALGISARRNQWAVDRDQPESTERHPSDEHTLRPTFVLVITAQRADPGPITLRYCVNAEHETQRVLVEHAPDAYAVEEMPVMNFRRVRNAPPKKSRNL